MTDTFGNPAQASRISWSMQLTSSPKAEREAGSSRQIGVMAKMHADG